MIKFRHVKAPTVSHEPKAAPAAFPGAPRFCSLCHVEIERIPAHAATRGKKEVPR